MKRLTEFIDESLNMVTESFQCSLLSEMAKNWKIHQSGIYSKFTSFKNLMDNVYGKMLRMDRITDDMGQYFQPGSALQKVARDIAGDKIPGFIIAYKDGKPYVFMARRGICIFFETNADVNVGAAMFVNEPTVATTARFISQFQCKVFMFDGKYHSEILMRPSDPDSPAARTKAKDGIVYANKSDYCEKIRYANRLRYETAIANMHIKGLKPALAEIQEQVKAVNIKAMDAIKKMSDEDILENQFRISCIMDALTSPHTYIKNNTEIFFGLNTLYSKCMEDFAGASSDGPMAYEYYGHAVNDIEQLKQLVAYINKKIDKNIG